MGELIRERPGARLLIASEATAGETYECQPCRKCLWDKGEPVFFRELAILVDKEVSAMLGPTNKRASINGAGRNPR
jgi:hypothetical protein